MKTNGKLLYVFFIVSVLLSSQVAQAAQTSAHIANNKSEVTAPVAKVSSQTHFEPSVSQVTTANMAESASFVDQIKLGCAVTMVAVQSKISAVNAIWEELTSSASVQKLKLAFAENMSLNSVLPMGVWLFLSAVLGVLHFSKSKKWGLRA
jgi:hypothetical protein